MDPRANTRVLLPAWRALGKTKARDQKATHRLMVLTCLARTIAVARGHTLRRTTARFLVWKDPKENKTTENKRMGSKAMRSLAKVLLLEDPTCLRRRLSLRLRQQVALTNLPKLLPRSGVGIGCRVRIVTGIKNQTGNGPTIMDGMNMSMSKMTTFTSIPFVSRWAVMMVTMELHRPNYLVPEMLVKAGLIATTIATMMMMVCITPGVFEFVTHVVKQWFDRWSLARRIAPRKVCRANCALTPAWNQICNWLSFAISLMLRPSFELSALPSPIAARPVDAADRERRPALRRDQSSVSITGILIQDHWLTVVFLFVYLMIVFSHWLRFCFSYLIAGT